MLTKIKTFLRKYWYLVAGAIVAAILLARRGAVLRQLSRLRSRLSASQRQLDLLKYDATVAGHTASIEEQQAAAAAIRADIATTTNAIETLERENSSITGRINAAQGWSELEALREEGNKR